MTARVNVFALFWATNACVPAYDKPLDFQVGIAYDTCVPENKGTEMSKKCTKCKEIKELGEFGKNRAQKDGLSGTCRECRKSDVRCPDYHREYQKKWRNENKEYVKNANKMANRRRILRSAKSSSKHTYLITDGEFIKVGVFTSGKLDKRLESIQNGNPRKLKVLATSESNIEKLCHYEFEHLNVLNEWFKLDLELITFFTENAE